MELFKLKDYGIVSRLSKQQTTFLQTSANEVRGSEVRSYSFPPRSLERFFHFYVFLL